MRLTLAPTDVPPGYPSEYERRLRLLDGRMVAIRPVVPADADDLADAILTADPDTLRRRFLGGPPPVTRALVERLTTVDYLRRFALVAADVRTGRGVAIARYEATGEGVAEVAVAVDLAWRRIGLATAMVELLARAALDRGIHEFTASYLAANRPVAALLALTGGADRLLIRQGIGEAAVALDREQVDAAVRALPTCRPSPLSIARCGVAPWAYGTTGSQRWTGHCGQ
jgi:RimJ/RimL family protein N-acetyltransferase